MSDVETSEIEHKIWVGTMYGCEANKGLVELSFGESTVQMEPKEAVEIGLELIQAAEVARMETFMVRFLGKVSSKNLTKLEIATLLMELREFYEKEEASP
jgi:hypothetical protein